MQVIINPMKQDSNVGTIVAGLEKGLHEQLVSGLAGSARQALMAALKQITGRPVCVVTHNMYQAQKVYEDLIELVPSDQVLLYPGNELIGSELAIASPEMLAQRIHVFNRLAQGFTGFWLRRLQGCAVWSSRRRCGKKRRLRCQSVTSWMLNRFCPVVSSLATSASIWSSEKAS